MLMCIELEYGSINQDGYVRILNKPRSQGGRLVMAHRHVWENTYGEIPEGYEINHKCKNRRCVDLTHLECLPISEHRAKDNAQRYKEREQLILQYFKDNPFETQRVIAKLFGITQSGVSLILKRNRNGA